ncbi:hypothetical protein U0070_008585 [Myodes glareolus]|uniref:Uncharacterized protein n=1 Tax=Myodes glareolus TaxID=447135 RepID=A0AAW0JG02_MYOGA
MGKISMQAFSSRPACLPATMLPDMMNGPPLPRDDLDPSVPCASMTFRIKEALTKRQKHNCPVPQRIQMKTANKIRYDSKKTLEENEAGSTSATYSQLQRSFEKDLMNLL